MNDSAYTPGILARATGENTPAGAPISAALDRVVLSGARVPATLVQLRDLGSPWDPEKILLTMDFQAPEVELVVPRSRALCRELSERFGLPHVFDLNMGIGSHVVLEAGLVKPGHLVAGSGRCLGVVGSVGALGIQLEEPALAQAMVSGELSLPVSEVVSVHLSEKTARYFGPWDHAAAISRAVGAPDKSIILELGGAAHDWPMDHRIGVCGLLTEMGYLAAIIAPDAVTQKFFAERGVTVELPVLEANPPSRQVNVTAADLVPLEGPVYQGPFTPLARDGGQPIHGVFIGSCYGGRYEDLALVAEVLKKAKQVHPGVRLVISPATLETARACLSAGFYEIFFQTGAMVVVPGGGPGSAGGGAIFGDGERLASTVEYHRDLNPGQGAPDVHLMSPASAAVAAVFGEFRDPSVSLA